MQIQYYLSDGQEITWFLTGPGGAPTLSDVDGMAQQYATLRPKELPDSVFISVRVYKDFSQQCYPNVTMSPVGEMVPFIMTGVGPLRVYIMPMASDAKLLLIGKKEDYERYDIDRVFEEVVLKDCERE